MEARDIPGVTRLAGQLGYPCSTELMSRRFEQLGADRDHRVFVAYDGSGDLLGCLHVEGRCGLIIDPFVQVFALVVDERHRSRRVGQVLMDEGERWAREQGYRQMTVITNIVRIDAHRFYQRLGYATEKTSHVMQKTL